MRKDPNRVTRIEMAVALADQLHIIFNKCALNQAFCLQHDPTFRDRVFIFYITPKLHGDDGLGPPVKSTKDPSRIRRKWGFAA